MWLSKAFLSLVSLTVSFPFVCLHQSDMGGSISFTEKVKRLFIFIFAKDSHLAQPELLTVVRCSTFLPCIFFSKVRETLRAECLSTKGRSNDDSKKILRVLMNDLSRAITCHVRLNLNRTSQ